MPMSSHDSNQKTDIQPEIKSAEPSKPTSILRTRIGIMTHLAPRGAVSSKKELADLSDAINTCIHAQENQVIIDLASVSLLNSAALDALLGFQKQLIRNGGWIKVAHINPVIKEIFDITGFGDLVPVLESAISDVGDKSSSSAKSGLGQRLGDILVDRGLVSEEQVQQSIDLQNQLGKRMGKILVEKNWISEKDMLQALAVQLGLPMVRLRAGLYDPDIVLLLDRSVAMRLRMLPLFRVNGRLSIATADPQALPSFDEVEERTGCKVQPVLCSTEDIQKAINDAYGDAGYIPDLINSFEDDLELVENKQPDDYTTIDEMAAESPVINLVNSIIQRAVHDGASDIHIEPSRNRCRIRFRIDGLLYEVMTPKPELHPAIVSRLKVMANLDIAERRIPQDGRIQVHTHGRSVDLRFSSLPGLFGEKVVLRVLDKNQAILDVDKLGLSVPNLSVFKQLLGRANGLILVTGPTGSGKTTSLYAALNYLNSIEKNIVTIEDPVEYQVDIINQNEVKANIGLTFAKMLKHVLRQDPDIIMVGEIREHETAEIAVQAALTGHLVLSTLHTNDSVGAITRMIEMGVEPYLLSSALIGVMAQRLVRTICPTCKTEYIAPPELVERYGWNSDERIHLAKGRGCEECYDSGYKGRMAVHEIIETNQDFQRLIISNPSRDELTGYLDNNNSRLIFDDGLDRVRQMKTTVEEVARVVNT